MTFPPIPRSRHPLRIPLAIVLAVIDLALGLTLVLEPKIRGAGPGLAPARAIAPLAVWGIVLAGLALLAMRRTKLDQVVGGRDRPLPWLLAAGSWHTFWAVSLLDAAITNHAAPLTGVSAYGGLAILHVLCGARRVT